MHIVFLTYLLVTSLCCLNAEDEGEKSEITKLEVIDLGEQESNVDGDDSEVQRKRASGYSYKRPEHFTLATRARYQVGQSAYKGRIVNRHPSQINRPVNKYGPPGYQNSPSTKPGQPSQQQQHRDKLQHHSHSNQQHSNNFGGRPSEPSGLSPQEVPSPIRHFEFVEPNPIASQNNEPFASHTANYLPPQNQKLPVYSTSNPFSLDRFPQNSLASAPSQPINPQSQNLVQSQEHQISDATLFLTQNAQAIQQLYGAPAVEQDFAPNNDHQFPVDANQIQNSNIRLENFDSSSQKPEGISAALPSYASGTLSPQETLEQIQSLEKDRLIVQLQRALVTQAALSGESSGRYAQNQGSFVRNQDLLASLGQQMKIPSLDSQPNTVNVASGNTAFNQSPFLPGTTISSLGFPFNYGPSTTTQTPTRTTTVSATPAGTTTVQPHSGTKQDGTTQVDARLPATNQPTTPVSPAGLPVYGGFVPTLVSSPSFLAHVPSYGTNFFQPGTVTAIQSTGSSPTHFGLPIPTETGSKPTLGSSSPSTPSSTASTVPASSRPNVPSSSPVNPASFPLAAPLHPLVTSLHPIGTAVHPLTPLQPVLPPSPSQVNPAQAPSANQPTYGLQTPLINPLLYKPIKPVYPLYYYPNVAYQLQRPAVPTYPWSYAPSYAQAKPAQIWK